MPVCVYTTHHTRANLKDSEDYSQTPSTTLWFAVVYPRVSLKILKSRSVLFYSFFINTIIKYKKVFRVFIEITNIHKLKPKHG